MPTLAQRFIPPLHISRAVPIRFDGGDWAYLLDQTVTEGCYVQRYEELIGVTTEGILSEGISSPVSGMVRWVIPESLIAGQQKCIRRGEVVAVVQADESPENAPFVTKPRPVAPLWVAAVDLAPVVSASGRVRRGFLPPDPTTRTAILPRLQTDEIEYITFDSPPVQNVAPTPFPYDLNGKAQKKTYNLSEEEVGWIIDRATKLKTPNPSHLVRCLIAHFAGLSDAEQRSILTSYNLRRKAK